ncbi:50S ribosomal protein L23 [candidate division WOR-3 bacterium]|nr:50S ribosomal protein L23 [candidate division WOR-3 bacterium]
MTHDRAREIILRPIVTEKSTMLRENQNKYCFLVSKWSNKIEVKKAVELLFNVKVEDVSVMNRRGKLKKLGRFEGRKSSTKRAVCVLSEGDKIEMFEGA